MTIQSTVRKAGPYACNGVTVAFPFAFKVFATSDVLVTQTDLSSVETPLTLASQYTVSLNADQNALPGGTVTLLSAPATGYLVTITSAIPEAQLVSLQNLGGFNPSVINDALDKVTALHQQLLQTMSRALTVPVSSPLTPAAYLAAINPGAVLNAALNVKNYGAVGNGIADDTAAIQAAITAAAVIAATTAVDVYFPSGRYLYSALNVNTGNMRLRGEIGAVLVKSTTTGNGITIKGLAGRIYNNRVDSLVFTNASTASAGAQIHFENLGQTVISNVTVANTTAAPFKGLDFLNVSQYFLDGTQVQGCGSNGVTISDCSDHYFSDCRSDANVGSGWVFDTCSGGYSSQLTAFGNTASAFVTQATIGSPVLGVLNQCSYLFFVNCVGDTSGSHNWFLQSTFDSVLSGCWGSTQSNATNDLNGFVVYNCTCVTLQGCVALGNNGPGFYVSGTNVGVQITGGYALNNGKHSAFSYFSGYFVTGTTSVQLSNIFAASIPGGGSQTTGLIVGSAITRLQMTGCDLSGCTVPYNFIGVPATLKESGNYTGLSTVIASAATLPVPFFDSVFTVSGTTGITDITGKAAGRTIVLIFQGILTVTDGGNLKLNGNYTTTADDTITLISDGTSWFEAARSVN